MTSDYVCLLPLVSPLDRDGLRKLAMLACLELYRVQWQRAFVADDGTRMLCWYRAPDAESVRFVLRQPLGSKRVPLENGYYETFNRDNVTLVDLRETPIERVTETGSARPPAITRSM